MVFIGELISPYLILCKVQKYYVLRNECIYDEKKLRDFYEFLILSFHFLIKNFKGDLKNL